MKRRKLLTFVLLFALSFTSLHAFVIDALDTHSCNAHEYVQEFSAQDIPINGDICHIHAAFHTVVILSEFSISLENTTLNAIPHFFISSYEYTPYNTLFKPPVTL